MSEGLANVTISRVHGGGDIDRPIEIRIQCEKSRAQIMARISLEEFASAITGLAHVPADIKTFNVSKWGMKRQSESVRVQAPIYDRDEWGQQETLKRTPLGWVSQKALFHNDGSATLSWVRWVEDD